MIVCLCKGINDNTIRSLLWGFSVEEIKQKTGVCTQCGKCATTLEQLKREEESKLNAPNNVISKQQAK